MHNHEDIICLHFFLWIYRLYIARVEEKIISRVRKYLNIERFFNRFLSNLSRQMTHDVMYYCDVQTQ